jgi:RHS repeat-associated protein
MPHQFTGKERDPESNLDNFGARYDSSQLVRFMSPDPTGIAMANPSDPQELNLYGSIRNNPLTFVDPTATNCVWDDGSYDG